MKHELKVKHYFRYADDFAIVSNDPTYLENLISKIEHYLQQNLKLELHPDKVSIGKLNQGIDFLGYIILPFHTILRTRTKQRMFKKLSAKYSLLQQREIDYVNFDQSLQSYLGILQHCDGYELERLVRNNFSVLGY